ncbi:MAG: hypothetical protein A2Z47_12510 [Thermodesulfovibrio sp. RBG_19FT_COMBO_42_12]|nr:MAG: hypothetical protein A2Z47_12510 [Thermodesulfovibrio sp. RBG_19FT_COMBO_42_12]
MFKRIILIFIAITVFAVSSSSLAQLRENDNPGADQPDDSALLGDDLFPTNLENITLKINKDSGIAILDSGYSRHAGMFFGMFLPVRMIAENEVHDISSAIRLLIIPSGGITSIEDREKIRVVLKNYVKEGGTLLVFSQRVGSDYSILPVPDGKPLTSSGWIEDQSTLSSSSILSMMHPIVSRLTSSTLNFNIDGSIESFPDRSKPLLRNRVSGQPVMIVYKYGKGTVIATALFTDWAYMHQRATWDEINLFTGLIKWTGLTPEELSTQNNPITGSKAPMPVSLPPLGFSLQSDNEIYLAGDKADFTIRLWNNENRARRIKIYYDGKGEFRELLPKGSTKLSYSFPVYSARRLWVYFYDENEIFLQTIRRGYSVVYP